MTLDRRMTRWALIRRKEEKRRVMRFGNNGTNMLDRYFLPVPSFDLDVKTV